MKKIKVIYILGLLFIISSASACSSTKKCNGKKGTRVPMGVMEANHE